MLNIESYIWWNQDLGLNLKEQTQGCEEMNLSGKMNYNWDKLEIRAGLNGELLSLPRAQKKDWWWWIIMVVSIIVCVIFMVVMIMMMTMAWYWMFIS